MSKYNLNHRISLRSKPALQCLYDNLMKFADELVRSIK